MALKIEKEIIIKYAFITGYIQVSIKNKKLVCIKTITKYIYIC